VKEHKLLARVLQSYRRSRKQQHIAPRVFLIRSNPEPFIAQIVRRGIESLIRQSLNKSIVCRDARGDGDGEASSEEETGSIQPNFSVV
jgi:hypothetical protein